jgi:hypothetical protein
MTEGGESADLKGVESFRDSLTILKQYNSKTIEGVDVEEFHTL